MKNRSVYAVARWVPKVLIGKRSAMPGMRRKCLGRMDSCGNTANWRKALLNLTWLALYDHEKRDMVYFQPVLRKHREYFPALELSLLPDFML